MSADVASVALSATGLVKHFPRRGGLWRREQPEPVVAVDDVSLDLRARETLALVGESGCGKTTTARMLLDIERPTAGKVYFEGKALDEADDRERRRYRSTIQAVFQDPWSSLNPRMRVHELVAEPLRLTGHARADIQPTVLQALHEVGLDESAADRFPHEFSGGQRQRIAIARAVAVRPRVIVLDEPVSALDVSVRAQVMNLLKDLQQALGISYLLISHDLATVRFLATRVAVMRQGRIIEQGDSEIVFSQPKEEYTRSLIEAARIRRPGQRS